MRKILCAVMAACIVAPAGLSAADVSPPSASDAIHGMVKAYVEAFNAHDAKALGELWSPDAVYTNRVTGEELSGRAQIAESFAAIFKAQPDVKLSATTESIQFLSPSVAVEHGTATVVMPSVAPEHVKYTAVYVLRDGKWLLDRVTDDTTSDAPSHYEHLRPLEWMVGNWVDEDESARVETECKWAKNRNFLTRSFTITAGDTIEMSGMQVIGWDPVAKTIRSWTFDSQGGFAEARWTTKDGRWFIHNRGVLADGRKAAMVNVIKPVDENSFTWQTLERIVGGELLPNVKEVLIVRR